MLLIQVFSGIHVTALYHISVMLLNDVHILQLMTFVADKSKNRTEESRDKEVTAPEQDKVGETTVNEADSQVQQEDLDIKGDETAHSVQLGDSQDEDDPGSDVEVTVEDEDAPTQDEIQACYNRIRKFTYGVKKVKWPKIKKAIEIEKDNRRLWVQVVADNTTDQSAKRTKEVVERYPMFRHPIGVIILYIQNI